MFRRVDSDDTDYVKESDTNVDDNDEDKGARKFNDQRQGQSESCCIKNKGKSSASSSVNEDALARLMVTEMGAEKKEERLAFLDIKMREVECRERELEQQDM
ncbi:hypothetical protein Tco_1140317, partial [Tanacetum coccineum]